MNWEAIGAAGEIVGALAVVLTLFYLAAQIRSSTRANRAQTFQAIFDGLSAHSNHMFSKENADLVLRGFKSYHQLPMAEKLVFDSLMANLFNYVEASYRTSEQGLLGQDTVENWSWYLRNRLLPYPGVREWWEEVAGIYPRAMAEWVRKQIAETDTTSDPYGVFKRGVASPETDLVTR